MDQITKYENRKLYSRTQKRYVTLSDIRDLLIAGKAVQVTNYDGTDITSKTLSKVVAVTNDVPVSGLTNLITKH